MAGDLASDIQAILPEIVEIRHDLHGHPQLGYQETYAAEVVQRELQAAGVPFQVIVGRTGIVAWLLPTDAQAARRKAVLLRADMDALPITEASGKPYASRFEGCMHACGHDGHTAMLVATARLLAGRLDQLPRPVKFAFQPAEEAGGGARAMIKNGALGDRVGPAPGAAFAQHGYPDVPLGVLRVREGAKMASTCRLVITVAGQGGHGAKPETARDPVVAAAQIITALQTIVSRNVRPTDPAVLSICRVEGGTTFNVIPDKVVLEGTIRAFSDQVADLVKQRAQELAKGVAEALGCSANVETNDGYPVVVNDPGATRYMRQAAERAGIEVRDCELTMGGEDFSYYGQHMPACFFELGMMPVGNTAPAASLHNAAFDFNDDALPVGIRIFCELALQADRLEIADCQLPIAR